MNGNLRKCDVTFQGETLSFLFMINTHLEFHLTSLKTVNHNPAARYCDYETTQEVLNLVQCLKGHDNGYKVGLLSAQQVLSRPVTKVT